MPKPTAIAHVVSLRRSGFPLFVAIATDGAVGPARWSEGGARSALLALLSQRRAAAARST